jgi:formylglycine-generating enzyme required for sulfatase activity
MKLAALMVLLLSCACAEEAPTPLPPPPKPAAHRVPAWADVVGTTYDPVTGYPTEVVHRKSGITMVLVPAPDMEALAEIASIHPRVDNGELPEARPFYIGKYEVTQAQWKRMGLGNPSTHQGDGRLPVETLPIHTIANYLHAFDLQLPLWWQWVHACTVGMTQPIQNLESVAWFRDNSGGRTHPVGQKKPNALGIYDMLGNVQEWCWGGIRLGYVPGRTIKMGFWRRTPVGIADQLRYRGGAYDTLRVFCTPYWESFRGGPMFVSAASVPQSRPSRGFRVLRDP